jgi:ribose 5-phosphate isomerase A
MPNLDDAKRLAARAALEELPAEGLIGLGTGSTARLFVEEVGALVRSGRRFTGVPTSDATRAQASGLGIPLLSDDGPWDLAVAVDGADEVDAELNLIKGGGGAHTREKIVNWAARRNVIIVDASKLSKQLGEKWPVPLEVLPFARLQTESLLRQHGAPTLRLRDGAPWRTDSGNFLYDLKCDPIPTPAELDRKLHAIPGVVETGLFCARADIVIVAEAGGTIRRLKRGDHRV